MTHFNSTLTTKTGQTLLVNEARLSRLPAHQQGFGGFPHSVSSNALLSAVAQYALFGLLLYRNKRKGGRTEG